MRFRNTIPLIAGLFHVAVAHTSDNLPFGWRMPCAAFPGIHRMDAIMAPNEPSNHGHMFFGSSRFHAGLTYEDLRASQCTSCRMAEDKSAYWVPPLYFKRSDGQYEAVQPKSGILVYYNRRDNEYEPFPAGFRMIAGNNKRRNSTIPDDDPWDTSSWTEAEWAEDKARERAIGFLCLNYKKGTNERAFARHKFPDKEYLDTNCVDGLRVELAFPSCWNGKDLDSKDHRSHVAYDRFVHTGGACPETHPIRLPSIIFEVVYATDSLRGKPGQYVFANGDTTGYGYHADFMNGWDPVFLKRALEECKNDHGDVERLPCNIMTFNEPGLCKAEYYKPLPELEKESCSGIIAKLCGSEKWNTTAPAEPAKPVKPSTPIETSNPVVPADPAIAAPSTESTKPIESAAPIESASPQASQAATADGNWHPPMVEGAVLPGSSAALALISESPKLGNIATLYETVTATNEIWHTVYDYSKRYVHHARRQ